MSDSIQETTPDKDRLEILYQNWSDRIKRGFLRIIVLKLFTLQQADGSFPAYSGTGLIEHIKEQTNDNWEPSSGSMYPIISELEKEGIIKLVNEENRFKEYQITDLGIKLLDKIEEDSLLFRSNFGDITKNDEERFRHHVYEMHMRLPLSRVKSQQKKFTIMADVLSEVITDRDN